MQASERLVIVTFQFIVLAVTFIVMVGTYAFFGFKTYDRRTSWEADAKAERAVERQQQQRESQTAYFGYAR
ncbi:MAG: hypothetical protein K2W95_26395 [Candidatus Obscuribacterales bacterium]|nr:hypothetical protein [Candidatus Obscuribacterales bacterium]